MAEGAGKNLAIRWSAFETPLGRMYAAFTGRGLCRLTWHVPNAAVFKRQLAALFPRHAVIHDPDVAGDVRAQLLEYFARRRRDFDVSIDLSYLSDFQRHVLEAARTVPHGTRIAYSELGRRISRPRAARAVGNALRHNPIPILIPCHRIIRADGSPGGYDGPNGTPEKLRLLQLESDFQ